MLEAFASGIEYTGIAQLVEHRSPKPSVVSSNLTAPASQDKGAEKRLYLYNSITQSSTHKALTKKLFSASYTAHSRWNPLFYKHLIWFESH